MRTDDLFAPAQDLPPVARTADPVSSHEAEAEINTTGQRSRWVAAVLDAVKKWPGRTSRQLSELSGIDLHMLGRRVSDLEHAGLIHKGPFVICPSGKRKAVTWNPGPAPITTTQEI